MMMQGGVSMKQLFGEYEKTGYLHEDFRLFHIKDQTKKEYSYHYHDFHKVLFFLSGNVTYHIEGKSYHLTPGDILLVSRHSIHKPEIDTSVPYDRYIFWIRDDLTRQPLTRCFQQSVSQSFHLLRLSEKLQDPFQRILSEMNLSRKDRAQNVPSFGAELLYDALFTQFMVYLNRAFLDSDFHYDQKACSYDSHVDQILQYISHNLTADLSIDILAGKYYLSKYHMMRKFKEETGYTIHNYILSKRLLMARTKISEGMPVIKAALSSGFKDYTAFERAYKKQFGKAPSQNR